MPSAAAKPCRSPGCGALVRDGSGYCAQHLVAKLAGIQAERRQYDKDRGSSAQRGYGARWQKARLGYLRSHPLCRACEDVGRVTLATVVDHKVPHRGDMALFWDPSNWQSLCKTCHDQKTARDDGGWGRGGVNL